MTVTNGAEEEVDEIPQRPVHHPTILPEDITTEQFDHAQFVGFLSGFKQNNRGDIIIGMTVPFRYRHWVMGLASAHGLPINVDVVPWQRAYTKKDPDEG